MSYDVLAPFYATLERLTFGRALQRARCAPLQTNVAPSTVLVLGDGDGRFLELAVGAWPGATFVVVDQSAAMLALAKKRAEGCCMRFVQADVRDGLRALDDHCFDVVVSHFFMDCFTESTLKRLVSEVADQMSPEGCWFVSEFAAKAWWHRFLLRLMYRFFHNLTETEARSFPKYGEVLSRAGFSAERLGVWRAGFVVADVWHREQS
ncbi:class I SAM-dependent methyltransferase [Verrucomicrobiales bacterium]|jgi:ubiquinone/menaquinone biosynthesis C-methylase UbiE|nr:class I SAM-dependent methyltransferase [Verrucomicrobiales bacterium]MDC0502972.1 class I SAM-dependent methyltransferase [Verrucomicrobiales bacterium]MDF1788371.1 class I SAM-dependent methyltransferase [Verrucomicrobiales bacterium]